MANEGFLQRWSRLKAEPEAPARPPAVAPPAPPVAPAAAAHAPPPTLADAAGLDADSNYAAFVVRGVDASVRRLAMKKLFADPHFNLVDGLDIYMGDYNLPDPVSPAMLASLNHARSALGRFDAAIDQLDQPDPPGQPKQPGQSDPPGGAEPAPPLTTAASCAEPPALPSPDQEAA
ncbi:MAG: DUF3306 domain-containing protein [Pseudomonadota bacterium]|nr:DUF3306 domain-containing protein [Pseudomonadota bacterium]